MAYERKGRVSGLPLHVQKPSARSEATADLVSKSQYGAAVNAPSGAVSVVGRPVSVFETLPAGAMPFRLNMERTLPQDWEYGDTELTLAEFSAPIGRVMVIESWEVRFIPYGVASSTGRPKYAARVMNTRPIQASITKNDQKQLGASDVNFYPFDGDVKTHVIYYGNQLGKVIAFVDTDQSWTDYFQKVEVILNGNYLLPNMQAPEYTELEVGIVRVGN